MKLLNEYTFVDMAQADKMIDWTVKEKLVL
jgi:hypothetical protein